MPKVVVYIRADDARVIEATEGREIKMWVRTIVREEIASWHETRAQAVREQPMPDAWIQHAAQKEE